MAARGPLVIVAVAVLIAASLFWLRGNIDGLVKDAVVAYGSAMTQARVEVGGVEMRGDGSGTGEGSGKGEWSGKSRDGARGAGQ